MAKPVFATNDVPTATQVNDWFVNINWIRKTASEDVTSSTALQNDDQLSIVMTTGVFLMTAFINYDAPTAAGISLGWTLPASGTLNYAASGPNTAAAGYADDQAAFFDQSMTPGFGAQGVGTRSAIQLTGTLIIVTGGTVQFRWAQRVSNATRTRIFAESFLDFQRRE